MSQQTHDLCEYVVHENGIHEFIMLDFSRAGVDAFAEKINLMTATALPSSVSAPLLIDSSRGTQPLNYLVKRMREIQQAYPQPDERGKIAMLHQPNIMVAIVNGMAQVFPKVQVRFFRPDEREQAVRWLTG